MPIPYMVICLRFIRVVVYNHTHVLDSASVSTEAATPTSLLVIKSSSLFVQSIQPKWFENLFVCYKFGIISPQNHIEFVTINMCIHL